LSVYAALKSRAVERDLGGCTVYVASLDDIVASNRISGRHADVEALPELEPARRGVQPR
jgi:hypothetical protein